MWNLCCEVKHFCSLRWNSNLQRNFLVAHWWSNKYPKQGKVEQSSSNSAGATGATWLGQFGGNSDWCQFISWCLLHRLWLVMDWGGGGNLWADAPGWVWAEKPLWLVAPQASLSLACSGTILTSQIAPEPTANWWDQHYHRKLLSSQIISIP